VNDSDDDAEHIGNECGRGEKERMRKNFIITKASEVQISLEQFQKGLKKNKTMIL
jgi:hypothetical protein